MKQVSSGSLLEARHSAELLRAGDMNTGSGAPSSVPASAHNRSDFRQPQDLVISPLWSISGKSGCLEMPRDRKGMGSVSVSHRKVPAEPGLGLGRGSPRTVRQRSGTTCISLARATALLHPGSSPS